MNKVWKEKGWVIGKSGDLLLTRRSERRYAERGDMEQKEEVLVSYCQLPMTMKELLAETGVMILPTCFLVCIAILPAMIILDLPAV